MSIELRPSAAISADKNPSRPFWRSSRLAGLVALSSAALVLSGCGDDKTSGPIALSNGQSITLENPNGGLSHLTSGPGILSASVAEEDREQTICTAQAGTHGTIEEQQVIDLLSYVKIKITDGECEGKTGWTSKTNIKPGA